MAVLLAAGSALGADRKASPPPDYPDTPPVGPLLRAATLPPVFSTRLDNGLEVVVVSNQEIPWVSVGWYLLIGAKGDPPEKAGLAALTAQSLRHGTARRSADELAELLDHHAITLNGNAGHETSVVQVGTLAQHLDLAVELLSEVIRRPAFDPDEYRRHVQQVLTALAVAEKEGSYLANREFDRRIYGDHYLARPSNGTSSTIKRIERDDLTKFHGAHYRPNGSILLFSGAVTQHEALALAREHFGDWPRQDAGAVDASEIPDPGETKTYLVDRPEATQTQIRIGRVGFRRTNPIYPTAQVFNQVFGGGFNSRLNHRVRISEGLTYGARGSFSSGKQPGKMTVSTFTRTEETVRMVRILLDEVKRMRDVPPTAEEMTDAQSFIIGRFGLSLETPQDVAGRVFDLKFYGLPDDYYASYLARIARVQPEDVASFAREWLEPGKMVIVLVGNASAFEKDLEGIAPVVRVDSTGSQASPSVE